MLVAMFILIKGFIHAVEWYIFKRANLHHVICFTSILFFPKA